MDANYYKGLQSFYFTSVILNVIKIGNLEKNNKIVLDFGCGSQVLSKKLSQRKIPMQQLNQEDAIKVFKEWELKPDKTKY